MSSSQGLLVCSKGSREGGAASLARPQGLLSSSALANAQQSLGTRSRGTDHTQLSFYLSICLLVMSSDGVVSLFKRNPVPGVSEARAVRCRGERARGGDNAQSCGQVRARAQQGRAWSPPATDCALRVPRLLCPLRNETMLS